MARKHLLFALSLSLIFIESPIIRTDLDEDFVFQFHLFHGFWMSESPGLRQAEVLSAASHPGLAALREKVEASRGELKAAAIQFLSESFDLKTLDDLWTAEKSWNGKAKNLSDRVLGKEVAFIWTLAPRLLQPRDITLRVKISKTKEGVLKPDKNASNKEWFEASYKATQNEKNLSGIIDQELILTVGDPAILAVPSEAGAYFLMIAVTPEKTRAKSEATEKPEETGPRRLTAPPKPVQQVTPKYPDELRRRGIQGEVVLRLTTGEDGAVRIVKVVKSLHPYLDFTATQAFKQWRFEPILSKGKPVAAAFLYAYTFNLWDHFEEVAWSEGAPPVPSSPSEVELRRILDGCAEYCRKLAGAALDFICEETIKEIHLNLGENIQTAGVAWLHSVTQTSMGPVYLMIGKRIEIMDPRRTVRNQYLCDYQLIKKNEKITERRFIMKENGRKPAEAKKTLEEKRFGVLRPLFASLKLLQADRQTLFNYAIGEEERIRGRKAAVVEVVPKSGDDDGVWSARIWIDRENFAILKSEIEGVPLEGYEDVLVDSMLLNVKPLFFTTHEYDLEKKGVLFPKRSSIRVDYPGFDRPDWTYLKLKIDLAYDKYKFFNVETENQILR